MLKAHPLSFPFVHLRLAGSVDSGDLRALGDVLALLVSKRRRWYGLVDCRGLERPNGAVRKELAEVLQRHESPAGPETWAVTAMVFDNRLAAGALTALRWLVPARSPEIIVATPDEGMAFLEEHAARDGLVVPDEFRAVVLQASPGG